MDSSPLGSLPGELRKKIYELVFYQPEGVLIRTKIRRNSLHDYLSSRDSKCLDDRYKRILALAQTCKELREEGRSFFFTLNTFHVRASPRSIQEKQNIKTQINACKAWLNLIGAQDAKLIRWLQIESPRTKTGDRGENVGPSFQAYANTINQSLFRCTLDRMDLGVTLTRECADLPEGICSTTGERISAVYDPITLTIPIRSRPLATKEINSVFAEREAMVESHGAHGCLGAGQKTRLLNRLRGSRTGMLGAAKSL